MFVIWKKLSVFPLLLTLFSISVQAMDEQETKVPKVAKVARKLGGVAPIPAEAAVAALEAMKQLLSEDELLKVNQDIFKRFSINEKNQQKMIVTLQSYADAIMPTPDSDSEAFGNLTMNERGSEMALSSPMLKAFLNLSEQKNNLPVLDIGAGYGSSTILALIKGLPVIATDLDPRHIVVLLNQVKKYCPKKINNLQIHVGNFPYDLRLSDEALKGVLFSNVAHYMSPKQFEDSLVKISEWLVSQGILSFLGASYRHTSFQGILSTLGLDSIWNGYTPSIERGEEVTISKENPDYLLLERHPCSFQAFFASPLFEGPLKIFLGFEAEILALPLKHAFCVGSIGKTFKALGFLVKEPSQYYNVEGCLKKKVITSFQLVPDTAGHFVGLVAQKISCPVCKKGAVKACAKCKSVYYCSRECQKADWRKHKSKCKL